MTSIRVDFADSRSEPPPGGSTEGMRRFVRRNPRLLAIVTATVILIGGGAAILWGKSRLVPTSQPKRGPPMHVKTGRGPSSWPVNDSRRFPTTPKAAQMAARAAAQQDRDQAAIAIYSRLILEDMDTEDLFLLGRSLMRTGKVDLAFKTFEKGRLANPDHPETLNALAELYMQNDRESAAEVAAKRLAQQPGWEARGLLLLGTAQAAHDPAGAAQALNGFFELDPKAASPLQAGTAAPVAPSPFFARNQAAR